MAENLRVTMRRNVRIAEEFTRQMAEAEGLMDRLAERAGGIGDRLAEGLQRAVSAVPAAALGPSDGGGGGSGPIEPAESPRDPGPHLPFGFLGPGAPMSGGGQSGGAGSGRGGFQAVGAEAPSGSVSGGQGSGSAAALTSGFQRVEGALASGLNRLASVPTAGERSISAAVAANTAAIGRLADVIGRSDGGAGFRARAGMGL